MRVSLDQRNRRIHVRLDNDNDAYFLFLLIDRGDTVRGWTVRDYRPSGAKESERTKMFLGIKVERVEYHRFRAGIRIHGVIVEAPEWSEGLLGRHHTMQLDMGGEVEIVKERYDEGTISTILDLARSSSTRILVLSLDDEEAVIAELSALGVHVKLQLHNRRGRGGREDGKELLRGFFEDVERALRSVLERGRYDDVVVVGPGMYIDMYGKVSGRRARYVKVSSGGIAGIYELQRTAVDLIEELNIGMGAAYVEELYRLLSREPGRVALGLNAVRDAAELGAVATLLITDEYYKERAGEAGEVVLRVHRSGGRTVIVPSESEPGQRLTGLGGVAAILRWSIEVTSPP